ncbi:MAG: thermonuclease family protein [Sphingobacteriia bacterium]|nr:thermonuclease family protein [Sphingobacteriia bacterium]
MTTNVDLGVGHHRLALFWGLAILGLLAPWAIAGIDWSALPFAAQPRQRCTVASIHDGDTLRAECNGERLQIRLYCIDAPEMAQAPWGRESRDHLRAITPNYIEIQVRDTDRYGRTVAEIMTPEGVSLNQRMVLDGQAAVYPSYCTDPAYTRLGEEARTHGIGIWSRPGDQQRPWDYRRRSG